MTSNDQLRVKVFDLANWLVAGRFLVFCSHFSSLLIFHFTFALLITFFSFSLSLSLSASRSSLLYHSGGPHL